MALHAVMLAMIIIALWPVRRVFTYYKYLSYALNLSEMPDVKERLKDSVFNNNILKAYQIRQVLIMIFPVALLGLLTLTGLIWWTLDSNYELADSYLFLYVISMTAYMALTYKLNPRPIWLLRWINILMSTRTTIRLEIITSMFEQLQQVIAATSDEDHEKLAVLAQQAGQLIQLGENAAIELTQLSDAYDRLTGKRAT